MIKYFRLLFNLFIFWDSYWGKCLMTDSNNKFDKATVITKKTKLPTARRKNIIIGVFIIIAIFVISSFISNNHKLANVIPGHAYHLDKTNRFFVFGEGRYNKYMVIVTNKADAIKATKSQEDFADVYNDYTSNGTMARQSYTLFTDEIKLRDTYRDSNDYSNIIDEKANLTQLEVSGLSDHTITGRWTENGNSQSVKFTEVTSDGN